MGTTFKRLGLSELLPRYVFAEGLYARRRVLEVGAVATTLGESARFLLTRGARSVLSSDADVAAVEAANKAHSVQGLRYRANVFDDLEGGSFDVVMVADLAPYVRAPELLRELTRLLSRGGLLIGGLRNPAGLALPMVMESEEGEPPPTWGQLLDALSSHFPSVEVATQSPVLGYQLAFERGDGLQVDGSLAEATEAAYFIAIAGQEPVRAVDPTWVQLPPEPLAYTGGKLEESARRGREWQERTERMKELLERAKKDVGAKEADLKDVREQLLGAREGVARLTVQLEELSKRPKAIAQQDDLAGRIRRLDAELGVARERAADAEGRVQASRLESEAQARAQKDAAVEAIAAQEIARLERSRREELVTQLEDARTRLASAYEQHGKLEDELAKSRVEFERARLQFDRVAETLNIRERELTTAKEREVRLAEARSEAITAVEVLEGQLAQAGSRSKDALAQLERTEGERLAAMRAVEFETQARLRLEQDFERTKSQLTLSRELVSTLEGERPGLQTELQEAKAGANRLARDIEVLAGSERTWRAMAQEFEQRLANTQANVETLSEQLSEAEGAKETEVARYRRLEKDLSTAVGAERGAREQAEVALAAVRLEVISLSDERLELTLQRDQITKKLADLEAAQSSIAGVATDLEGRVKDLEERNQALTQALVEAREREAALQLAAYEQDEEWVSERTRFTSRIDDVTAALTLAQSVGASLELKVGQVTTQAAEALQKGTDAEAMLREQVDALTAQQAARTVEREQLAADLRQTTAERVEDEAHAQRLEVELGELKAMLAAAESESTARKAAIEALRAQLEASERRFQTTDEELQSKIAALEQAGREQSAESEASRNLLEERLRGGQVELEQIRIEHEKYTLAHEEKLAALDAAAAIDRQSHQDAIAKLAAEHQQLWGRQVESLVAEHARTIDESEAQLTQARQEHQQKLDALALEHERGAVEHRQQLDAMLATHEVKVSEFEGLKAAHAQESEAISSKLRQEVEVVTRELESARTQTVDQASALETLRAEHARDAELLQAKLLAAQEEAKGSKRRLDDAETAAQLNDAMLVAARQTAQQREDALTSVSTITAQLESKLRVAEQDEIHLRLQMAQAVDARLVERDAASNRLGVLEQELQKANEVLADARSGASQLQARYDAAAQQEREARNSEHLQQLAERETIFLRASEEAAVAHRRALDDVTAIHRQQLDARDAAHQQELDSRSAEAQTSLAQTAQLERKEADSLKEQLGLVKEDRDKWRGTVERTQSEARGHQSGKLSLQKELDKIREELRTLRAASGIAGGESQTMAEARAQAEHELTRLRARVATVEAELPKAQARRDELEAALPRARAAKIELDGELKKSLAVRRDLEAAFVQAKAERRVGDEELARARDRAQALESELSSVRGTSQGSTSDLEVALVARRQAEELLLSLRTKYAELQDNFQHVRTAASDLPRLKEELSELKAEAQMLEAERERLSAEVERLEQFAPGEAPRARDAGDFTAELVMAQEAVIDRDARLEVLLNRLQAQDAELAALQKKAIGSAIGRVAVVKKALPLPAPTPVVPVGALPKGASARQPAAKPPAPPSSIRTGVELEVFELDIDEEHKDEELFDDMLVFDEDEPLTPIKK